MASVKNVEFETTNATAIIMFPQLMSKEIATSLLRAFPPVLTTHFPVTELFGVNPMVPPDFPFPIVQITDGKFKTLAITPQRLEITFNRNSESGLVVGDVVTFALNTMSENWESFEEAGLKFNRFAMVVNRHTTDEFTPKQLVEKFCNDKSLEGPFSRPETFEIHAHKTFDPGFGRLNSWVRLRTTKRNGDGIDVVHVEQDMNTFPGEPLEKTAMTDFFSGIGSAIEECFKIYFPT